jgi:hypothetical protein
MRNGENEKIVDRSGFFALAGSGDRPGRAATFFLLFRPAGSKIDYSKILR